MGWIGRVKRLVSRSEPPREFVLKMMPRRGVCAEIGVFRGDFSQAILRTTRPTALHLIDPWKFEEDAAYQQSLYGGEKGGSQAHMDRIFKEVGIRFRTQIEAGIVRMHRCTSQEASGRFADESFDWVYIDGNHRYEFVRADLTTYFSKVKRGGYVAGDDYGLAGWWEDGVTKAVDEFAARDDCELVALRNHQYILRKR